MIKLNKFTTTLMFSIAMTSTLSGCSSTLDAASKIGKVIMDPSIPVGKQDEQPSTLTLSFLSEKNINPNDQDEPSPLEVQVVYLTEDSKLLSSYYEQFSGTELKDVLGKNYIDHQNYTVDPNQYKVIPNIKLEEENRYLGVIAYYSDPEKAQWRKVIKLEGEGHKYNILIHLLKMEVDIKEYE